MQFKCFIVPYNGLLELLQVCKCIKTSIKQVNEKVLVRAQVSLKPALVQPHMCVLLSWSYLL